MSEKIDGKISVELSTELENESFKVQVRELELDGKYLFVRGIVLDVGKEEATEFEDSIDMSDFCCNGDEPSNGTGENSEGTS